MILEFGREISLVETTALSPRLGVAVTGVTDLIVGEEAWS
jgi:hypothetical protein